MSVKIRYLFRATLALFVLFLIDERLPADKPPDAPTRECTCTSADSGVELSIRVSSRNDPGKPIILTVEIRNESKRPASLNDEFQVTVRDGKGKAVAYTDFALETLLRYPSISIQPGGAFTDRLDLTEWFHLQGGKYLVTVGRIFNHDEPGWGELRASAPFIIGKVQPPGKWRATPIKF